MGDNAIKQCMCMILEIAPYKSKRCFIPDGMGVEITTLLMLKRVSSAHLRCTLGYSDALRAVSRYPHGNRFVMLLVVECFRLAR